jgi:phospholipase C
MLVAAQWRTSREGLVSDPVRHVLVLMMENRSFDHMLGDLPNVDGVNPAKPFSNTDPFTGGVFFQQPDAVDKLSPDPAHETDNVLRQIRVTAPHPTGPRDMSGFVADMVAVHPRATRAWKQVMSYFGLGRLPAMHRLAQEFCVCDQWFSSVPGPTWTNRFFMHSGTSQGWVEMPHLRPPEFNLHKYDQPTLYDRLNDRGLSWRIYVGDVAQSLLLLNQRRPENLARYRRMSSFTTDLEATSDADFPAFVFIEPSYLPGGQNDQHPPHDVHKGDALIEKVFEAIRKSKIWDTALLIITYDEHGGFCDHVPPPNAVAPDTKVQDGFDFTMYGVRVPTILVSKWVAPGSVFRAQQGVLDHTSVLRYLSDKYDLDPLGARAATAASIAPAVTTTPNDAAVARVGPRGAPPPRTELIEAPVDRLNPNQAALIAFTKFLEVRGGVGPESIGLRSIRSRGNPQAEVETAIDRFWEFVDRGAAR